MAAVRRLDFNSGGSPTQSGFVPVAASAMYTAATGLGWASPALAVDRGTAPGVGSTDLYRDLQYGQVNTFKIQVPVGGTVNLRVYLYDAGVTHDQIKVTGEGGASAMLGNLPAGTLATLALSATDTDSNGIATVTFRTWAALTRTSSLTVWTSAPGCCPERRRSWRPAVSWSAARPPH